MEAACAILLPSSLPSGLSLCPASCRRRRIAQSSLLPAPSSRQRQSCTASATAITARRRAPRPCWRETRAASGRADYCDCHAHDQIETYFLQLAATVFLNFPCRDPEPPAANSPPWAHRYKQCKDGSDAASRSSGDTPPPDKTPATAPLASQSCADKPSPDRAAKYKPRRSSSARHCRKR